RYLTIFLTRLMARCASNREMGSFQRKLGHSVIESIRIKSNNIGVPTLVIGMTVFALHAGNIGNDAMKATLPDDGFLDILVTEEAQIILPLFSERSSLSF
ncbi:hypothetical protein, partial [Alteromonas abrolhosensis]|uniref:hypothetical protein n=1 Tax=Alteromonas abrolhosensis TaxID=1892904 RepID=UPI003BAD6C8D